MSEQPSWMSSSATTGVQAPAAGLPAATGRSVSGFGLFFVRAVHAVNVILSALLAWSGVVGVRTKNPTEFFIGLYVMIFALMLFTYEILRIFPENSLNDKMRRNFGWLYGYIGLGLFLIFAGALNFGVRDDVSEKAEKLTLWTGIVTCGWGLLIIVACLGRPEWFDE